ncbi:uncharacterized protein LOC135687776 [Rhopilema esculentum]|uniref:uncharacterized protein LOC135687776 n=1 Tax=Rhopilema esculentum TaxID=499914 RepID=UPI0031D0B0A3
MPIAKEKEVACGEILWHENSLLLAREGIAAHSPPREIPLRDLSIKTGYHAKLSSSSVAQGALAVIEKRMHFPHVQIHLAANTYRKLVDNEPEDQSSLENNLYQAFEELNNEDETEGLSFEETEVFYTG